MDLDLDSLGIELDEFWELARPRGLSPIIDQPSPKVSESWHFDCRGSHQIVYDYYKAEKGLNFRLREKLRQTWAALAPSQHKTHYMTSPQSGKPPQWPPDTSGMPFEKLILFAIDRRGIRVNAISPESECTRFKPDGCRQAVNIAERNAESYPSLSSVIRS